MPRRKCDEQGCARLSANHLAIVFSPLNQAELDVLRAQYEKEGDMVGTQTRFNYAWVSAAYNSLRGMQKYLTVGFLHFRAA